MTRADVWYVHTTREYGGMKTILDQYFGVHEQALKLRGTRAQMLGENIANADTPNYKARDIDFAAALARAQGDMQATLRTTSDRHIALNSDGGLAGEPLYRIPQQASLDGNTVDSHVEKSEFLRNSIQFEASLKFVDMQIRQLLGAIKGD